MTYRGSCLRPSTRPTKVLTMDSSLRFQYSLARELGMTRKRLVREMPSRELPFWMALYAIEAREREQAEQRAEDRAKAAKFARGMRGLRAAE
jgi:hypothetical protein